MDYREFHPAPDLQRWVRCYWTLLDQALEGQVERVLPDGRSELIVHLSGEFECAQGGSFERQPDALYVGQMEQSILLRPAAEIHVFGVCFLPWGASAFSPWPQSEATGRILALGDVWGAAARQWRNQLHDASGNGRRVEITDRFLRSRMRAPLSPHPAIRAAISRIQREPATRIDEVARFAGVSRRQMERRFLTELGLTPKSFARLVRFQSALKSRQHHSGQSWVETALSAGYYDQAHLIADFREFAGTTPVLQAREQTAMERLLARGPA